MDLDTRPAGATRSPESGLGLTASTLFRFATAGSVDDGKSTLVGRLLHDSKAILADQLDAITRASAARGFGGGDRIDFALLTDGLRAEREQGITIDVAYRGFVTPRRRFQLADAPGHVQYTRNMVTGASTAELGIVLVDARQGVVEQTRRHAYILSILRVPHAVVAVNKMDLVDWSQDRFAEIVAELDALGLADMVVIPISALQGDNVVDRSEHMSWYDGPPLLEYLETVEIASGRDLDSRRFPVQWVIRPRSDEHHDFRGYAGQVAGGVWGAGDEVVVLPAGLRTQVESVETIDGPLEAAIPPMSVTIRLADDVDVSRGDLLADPADPPVVARELEARVCWMSERPLEPRARFAVKQTSRSVRAIADELVSRIDVHTLEDVPAPDSLGLNDIGVVRLRLSEPLCVDPYEENRTTGAFVLIDESSNETVGAGMVLSASP
jgi:sulfate adenylyltransferase large subunit